MFIFIELNPSRTTLHTSAQAPLGHSLFTGSLGSRVGLAHSPTRNTKNRN
ncbi:hypothetical protein HanPSC8_Chr07g0304131 [Helianthus annuus]|nr:hypothetical protein HanPSC8_Chr07g0304131 [Helianthus annuus]